jgi:hypothetical protein
MNNISKGTPQTTQFKGPWLMHVPEQKKSSGNPDLASPVMLFAVELGLMSPSNFTHREFLRFPILSSTSDALRMSPYLS